MDIGPAVHFEGTHYRIDGAIGTPRPHQGAPPVCIGGGGRRILSLAAREADIVSVNVTLTAGKLGPGVADSATPRAFDEKIGWIRDAAGDRFDTIELQCHCPFVMVTADAASIAERMGSGFGLSAAAALEVPLTLFGTVEELCDMVEPDASGTASATGSCPTRRWRPSGPWWRASPEVELRAAGTDYERNPASTPFQRSGSLRYGA